MPEKNPPRKAILTDVETAVLAKSARRCSLCYHLDGDLAEKLGQIAHLDGDRTNRAEENLAWMCLPHHSTYDSKTKQHKNYTISEVKAARDKLYALVAEGNHLSVTAAQPSPQIEADRGILRDIMQTVPSNGSIRFVRTNHFGGVFELSRLDDIETFYHDRNGPDHEFLDLESEALRKTFRKNCEVLLVAVASQTYPSNTPGWNKVPDEWHYKQRDRWDAAVGEIHAAAEAVGQAYDELVKIARRKLTV
jgi:hypothetical protein